MTSEKRWHRIWIYEAESIADPAIPLGMRVQEGDTAVEAVLRAREFYVWTHQTHPPIAVESRALQSSIKNALTL